MRSCESGCGTAYDYRGNYRVSMRSIFMIIIIKRMFDLGTLTLVLLAIPAFAAGISSPCAVKNVESRTDRIMPAQSQINPRNELKIIAEGSQSSITKSFIAVIRDAETYEALRRAAGNLPDTNVDFDSHILIAAFLGERNTGGYSVEMAIEVPGTVDTTGPA